MSELKDQLNKAIAAHGSWKVKLKDAIAGKLSLVPSEVAVDNRCEFGKWLHGLKGTPAANDSRYKEILELHAQFHKCAAAVVTKALAGDIAGANASMGLSGDYANASSKLTAKMMDWLKAAA